VWNGQAWSLFGGVAVEGVVTCLASAGSGEPGGDALGDHLLYIAGRFGVVGSVEARNVAVYNVLLDQWKPLGRGLRARDVFAITIWPGNGGELHSLFAVGSISHAGDILVGNVARWRALNETWYPMRNINGLVRAAAVMGSRLFIGGDFTVAGGQPAAAIAFADIAARDAGNNSFVEWREVGIGVQGNVHVLRAISDCMYVGGRIDSVGDHEGVKVATNVARWCVAGPGSKLGQEKWEPIEGINNAGGTVLAIAGADNSIGPNLPRS
jgi:hypothetical protein